jgi:hypothetical protein
MLQFRKARSREEETPATFNTTDRTWSQRPGVVDRIREKLELSIAHDAARRDALHFLGKGIENADEERSDAWYVRETDSGLRLMAGRLLACEIAGSKLRISVVGPVTEEVRNALGADSADDEEFKAIPSSVLLTLPVDHSAEAANLLAEGCNSFVDAAMARVRRPVSLEDHAPEAVVYIGSVLGRELPQPEPPSEPQQSAQLHDTADEDDAETSREPRIRGRAPIFEHGQRSIASLVSDIEREAIALPDLQRQSVWEDTKVRDLLDSLFLGFPVGTLVLWHTSDPKEARTFAAGRPGLRADTLVIDGQQRLTSLYAVMRGVEVVGKDGSARKIAIAFRPRDGKFDVLDAAIRKDPKFLPNVTELWSGARPKPQIRRDLINALRDGGRSPDENYEDAVERNLDRAHAISEYRFPTVDIRKTAARPEDEATDEDVAEIFVRINNQGTRLGQADFVLTLLSVFHGELRDRMEARARGMSLAEIVGVDAQQLLRAACAVAFGRARMLAIYRYLRGVDPTTGEADPGARLGRLQELDRAAQLCMDPAPWRDYVLRVKHAGFVNQALIASRNAVVNAYAFYVRGRGAGVSKARLDELIARWVFGTLLTARYSGASETVFEQDLARVGRLGSGDADGFVQALDDALGETITGDYWTHSLVSALETQKGRAPAALAFRAAQVVLGTRALFTDQLLQNLLEAASKGVRAASEVHHLFPEAWLHARGIRDRRRVNQVANLAHVGWHENTVIGSQGPAQYVPRLRKELAIDDNRWGRVCAEHALPLGWESMDYEEFLRERRSRMADIIRVAFRQLGGEAEAPPVTPPWFLPGAEQVWKLIAEVERALRIVVREVYLAKYGSFAAERIEERLPEAERQTLTRALRTRPAAADALTLVDYLYLGQLLSLLFVNDIWPLVHARLREPQESKKRLAEAVSQISAVRNEIAHVREAEQQRLLRARVACADVLQILKGSEKTPRI